jgi:hypothetical protein
MGRDEDASYRAFVICVAIPLSVPAYEIMADVLYLSGPAALLCHEIFEQPWHLEGKSACMDQRVPRVAKVLMQYEVDWLGGFVKKCSEGGVKEEKWLRKIFVCSRKA